VDGLGLFDIFGVAAERLGHFVVARVAEITAGLVALGVGGPAAITTAAFLCRTAVASSIAFCPNEPSPCRQMTCAKGFGGPGGERKRHPHTHRAERPGIEPVAGEQSRDRLAAKIQDLPPVDPLQGRTRRRAQVGTAAIVRGGRCLCHPVGTPQVQADAPPDQRRQRLVRPGTPGQPNTLCPLGIMSRQRRNIGSRVTREGHARFWERPGVKFRRATRRTSPFRGEDRKVCNRRISPVAAQSGDCLLSERIAGTQPWRREPLFMPQSGLGTGGA
jgi:hypothetical protein